ncbi:sulfurtransferase [Falsiroseomonas bella]|uniref:Sulfurtransferase n=1 Tax=Falsiroseomonas bella TaxID=2184016 RepID=A0A317F8R8_9PROT|nr:rhodanese-like domain-containing protein [Falsiroseomonas bella]PWS34872.1 sulfurtransferase [Falsiroseomonas bella]
MDGEDGLRERVFVTPERAARMQGAAILAIRNPRGDERTTPRIPGAVDVDLPSELAAPGGGTRGSRPLPEIAELQRHARGWGLRQGQSVIVYDHDRGLVAGRAWWVLRWAGIADVRMLDGGFPAWVAAGLPVVHRAPAPQPGDVVLSAGHLPVLDEDGSLAMARSGVLLDSRVRPNYIGGAVPPGAPARGHIPGALSAPAADNFTEPGPFADAATLRHLYAALGADGTRPVGVYCGAGISAAVNVAALASLGIEAAMYPGSWSAWSADPARPVVVGGRPE